MTDAFSPVQELLNNAFYKPDFQALRISMGVLKSHYLNINDAPWLFLVAPPGSGKTTTGILGSAGLRDVKELGKFTEATLFSGFYCHEASGILEKFGEIHQFKFENGRYVPNDGGALKDTKLFDIRGNVILLIKDFTTILQMRRDSRANIIAQLRELHDGSYECDFGTGITKRWQGKLTILAAVTPEIDRMYSVMSSLGERFLKIRWDRPAREAGEIAYGQSGRERSIRAEIQKEVKTLFDAAPNRSPKIAPEMVTRISYLADLVAHARSHVSWESGQIDYTAPAEANTRITKQLAAIATGVAALRCKQVVDESEWEDILRVGLDSILPKRKQVLLAKNINETTAPWPRTSAKRVLDECEALGLISADSQGNYYHTELVTGILSKCVRG